MRHQIALSFYIKELNWKVVLQVNDAALFKTEVELFVS